MCDWDWDLNPVRLGNHSSVTVAETYSRSFCHATWEVPALQDQYEDSVVFEYLRTSHVVVFNKS